jgi:DNA-binding GntR family transcriptional regulator
MYPFRCDGKAKVTVSNEISPDSSQQLTEMWDNQAMTGATSDMVHSVLQEAIISQVLKPGQRLTEEPLAGLFSVSRTPVREAIVRLEAEHFAERIPRRGIVVSRVSRQEIIDVYVVREASDGLAAYLAALHATPTDISRLEWINQQFSAAASAANHDLTELAALNLRFHEALAEASKNTLLMKFVKQVHNIVRRFGNTTFRDPERVRITAVEHARLVEAIKAGDAELARAVAVEHTAEARRIRIAMIEQCDSTRL